MNDAPKAEREDSEFSGMTDCLEVRDYPLHALCIP